MAEHSESKPPPTFFVGLDLADREEKLEQLAKDLRGLSRPETDRDPLFQTMQLWTEAQKSPESLRELLRRLTPVHGYFLEYMQSTRFGLHRLMLETARRHDHAGRETGMESLRLARFYVENLPIESEADRRAAQDLRALASAYWADQLRRLGRHVEAEQTLAAAEAELDEADDEMRATVAEIRANLLQVCGDTAAAVAHLDQASREFSSRHPIPGRWAQLQLNRGRHHLAAGFHLRARSFFLNALESCPEGRALCTRYEVHHLLAATAVALGRYEQAREHLEVTGTLEDYGHPWRRGQRLWFLGHVVSKLELPEDPGDLYLQAFRILRDQKCWKDATRVLRRLIAYHLSQGDFQQVLESASLVLKAEPVLITELISQAGEICAAGGEGSSPFDRFLEEMEAMEKADQEKVH